MLSGNLATGPWHQVPIDDALLPLDCLVSQFRCDVLLPEQPSLWRKKTQFVLSLSDAIVSQQNLLSTLLYSVVTLL